MNDEPVYRVAFLLVAAANIAVSGVYRNRARKLETIPRSAESKGLRAVRAAFALPGLAAMLIYLVMPSWLAWAAVPLPATARIAGVVLGVVTVALMAWVLRNLGSNVSETVLTKREHSLVTSGPYRFVRHPLYGVGFLFLAALSLIAGSALIAGLAVAGVTMVALVIVPREEAHLVEKFGESYRLYKLRTGAIFPRLGSRGE